MECNIRNIFLYKSFTKCGGETIARPFSKNSKLSISLDISACQVKDYLNILKLSCRPFAYNSYKSFKKKSYGNSFSASFSA